jgi:hypothetical protein
MSIRPTIQGPGKAYLAGWLILGTFAAAFTGTMALDLAGSSNGGQQADAGPSIDALASDQSRLQAQIRSVNRQIVGLGDRLGQIETQQATIVAKLDTIGSQRLAETPAPVSPPVNAGVPAIGAAAGLPLTTGSIIRPSLPPAAPAPAATAVPPPERKVLAEPTPLVPVKPQPATQVAAAPAQEPAPAPPPPQKFGVQLVSGKNLDALRLSWLLLTEQHKGTLDGLAPHYRKVRSKTGMPYQLIAGPVETKDAASDLCKRIASPDIACSVTNYDGSAL